MTEVVVKVMKKGMISIPAEIRKKHNIVDGQYIIVSEDEGGTIKLEPIESIDALRKRALTVAEFKKHLVESRKEDLELEK
nr:AbrB/MazE/SpoVT family DNA-binding domain-containing protein [Candidatus Sigynarchaeota archaeon]